jgi:subtilisin family serine protease
MSLKTLKLCQALALAGLASSSLAATPAAKTYIVQLNAAPVAQYEGGVAGLAATKVAEGERLDARSANVQAYRSHLHQKQREVLAAVGAQGALHHYSMGLNGFAARLTPAQVARLKARGDVRAVVVDERREAVTVSTPAFLGLDQPGGAWSRRTHGALDKGEDIIIAAIDSGVQPENPSFFDRVDANGTPVRTGGTQVYGAPPAKWTGTCDVVAGFPSGSCNNKLIGARVFSAGFKASGTAADWRTFLDAPRDENGHGSHTLSTAGGNSNAPAVTSGGVNIGTISGIAPRARVAAYKALFQLTDGRGSGMTSDLVAAIDQAVADGVDVINYSVSGSQTNLLDPVEVAFLGASDAGVFVAASAGNSGPANMVAHNSPWITTVAASTHDRQMAATLTLGNGGSYTGSSFNQTAVPAAAMVLSSDVAAAGVPVSNANLCYLGSLDPAKAAGKVVVCDRGVNARVDKSAEVARVGGVGMVLINPSANTLVADFHTVPTVHLPHTMRTDVRNYVAAGGGTGAIGKAFNAPGAVAPVMASFSSRGPNLADSSVMKPDITAPGVDIIAGYTHVQVDQAQHDAILAGTFTPPAVVESLQGTSMSAPHVAGAAALLKQRRPTWSPAAIKSALLTSATGVKNADGTVDTDRVGYGAGHLNPNGALDQPLIYPANTVDYLQFLCGAGWLSAESGTCGAVGAIEPTNLNLPTFALEVPGVTKVHRSVRNVGGRDAVFTASASVPGYDVTVEPSTLSLAKGQTGKFTVTLKTNGAAIGTRTFGTLSWSDGSRTVTSPIQAVARNMLTPSLLTSTAASGKLPYQVQYGFAGATSAHVTGLKAATLNAGTVATGNSTCFALTVPANGLVVRAALHDSDTSGQGGDDLDLELYNPAGTRVAYSGGATANETVSVSAPTAGDYTACVIGYAAQGGSSSFTLSSWVLSTADQVGNLKVNALPSEVAVGDKVRLRAVWNGLTAGTRYLGAVRHAKADGSFAGQTVLSVEPGAIALSARGPELTQAKARAQRAR